jgi:hypothetical protein
VQHVRQHCGRSQQHRLHGEQEEDGAAVDLEGGDDLAEVEVAEGVCDFDILRGAVGVGVERIPSARFMS